ncbi:PREDICTED: uncharacterized protein LOC109474380 [Branchiostoma belcheri]|uniref:Uncharacterized protein LOC109474380 n=1 Tax=Branchiostoma belcheri TaxID=7741 RepID=A0A6P4Z141_BRABE|nr:PREDICTED: uncharacterized protein LOC109474380 [Branchiostoma belcheri]
MPDVDGSHFRKYIFPFENLVLEGGGAKGMAYVGALKVLEDAGILRNIKRFGGTSAGSITAGFLAVGMSPQDILDKSNENLKDILLRGSPCYLCGKCKYLWNLYNLCYHYGAYPATYFVDWYGKAIEEHLQKVKNRRQRSGEGNPDEFDNLNGDITFAQVYNAFGKELCTVSYETEFQTEVYSHVKTSPLLEIREAVRMSMSIPVYFEAYKPAVGDIQPPVRHIDGGVSANYPIYCFEGWWLSMDQGNTFCQQLSGIDGHALKQNFLPDGSRQHFQVEGSAKEKERIHKKTIGACLFSDTSLEGRFQPQFNDRLDHYLRAHPDYQRLLQRPNTKFANEYRRKIERLQEDRTKFKKKLEKDLQVEDKIEEVVRAYPDLAKMRQLFDSMFTAQDVIQMYGKDDKDAAFKMLFLNHKNEPTTTLAHNIYRNQKYLQEAKNKCLKGTFADKPTEFYAQLEEFMRKNRPMEEYDVGRSIGINVDYITTFDFGLATEDEEFLMAH